MLRSKRHCYWWVCKWGCCHPNPSHDKNNQRAKENRAWQKTLDTND